MATTIKHKRGTTAPTGGTLAAGELGLDTTNKRAYTSTNGTDIIELGTNPAAEIQANAGIALPDNQKATFGASDDLQIYHDGSHSYINDTGTGDLFIKGDNNLWLRSAADENYIRCDTDGAVWLYYDNVNKLTTTSTGIDVTGTLVTDAITNSGSSTLAGNIFFNSTSGGFRFQTDAGVEKMTARLSTDDLKIENGSGVQQLLIKNSGGIDVTGTVTADELNIGTPNDLNSAQVSVAAADNAFIEVENKTTQLTSGFMWTNTGTRKWTLEKTGANHNLFLQNSSDTTSVQFHQNNDISFYEDTGTTAKFFWDASAESLGIGTSSPAGRMSVVGGDNASQVYISGATGGTGRGLRIATGSTGFQANDIVILDAQNGTSGTLVFQTQSTERMRIDSSGNLLVGTTTNSNLSVSGHRFVQGTGGYVEHVRTSTADTSSNMYLSRANNGNALLFYRNDVASTVGTISVTTTATAYNTSSDYRLKENVVAMDDASSRVLALKPCRFNFIADPDKTVDGFLAHEAQEVVPEAVTGTKDAMRTEEYEVSPAVYEDVVIPAVEEVLDEEGNVVTEAQPERTESQLVSEAVMGTREVPDYQGIDQSKLVPLLTKALQEALERIAALEAKVG